MDRCTRTWMSGAGPRSERFCGGRGAFVFFVMASLSCGCASRGNTELLEAHLREHQDRVSAYERQVSSLREELVTARAEADQLRRELVALGKDGRQEATEPLARVVGIQFNPMMTGGRDSDDRPGHDVITAVLAPHDRDGDLVKLGGELEIEVLDLTRAAEDRRIGHWKYTAEQARELWHSGFLASGYQLDLPIGGDAIDGEVILHGRIVTADGRQFDTTCPVRLVSAERAPKKFAAESPARPLAGGVLEAAAAADGRGDVKTASTGIELVRHERPAEGAGFAVIEDDSAPAAAARPVPMPPDEAADALPVVRPGGTPRPFPAGGAGAEEPGAGRQTGGVRTSDAWTDETIPHLR